VLIVILSINTMYICHTREREADLRMITVCFGNSRIHPPT